MKRSAFSRLILPVLCLGFFLSPLWDQMPKGLEQISLGESELRDAIHLFLAEELSLERQYGYSFLPLLRQDKMKLYRDWQKALSRTPFAALSPSGRIDYLLFAGKLTQRIDELERAGKRYDDLVVRFPFVGTIAGLAETRRRMRWVEPKEAAAMLAQAARQLKGIAQQDNPEDWQALKTELEAALDDWYRFFHLYDPLFDWWVEAPYLELKSLLETVRGAADRRGNEEGLDGVAVGEKRLRQLLQEEYIAYTPQELIEMGQKELAWCVAEMRKLSVQLGFSGDLRKVLDHVKNRAVDPGEQPEQIRKMAFDAVAFLEKNDLLTIPEMAKNDWHIEMLSARQQLMNPFFTGGDDITLSYPTRSMSHERKLMSMRGNNPHFCWATVHHELIPGHHLQFYMAARYNTHRTLFDTPFYVEGWPLYWEMKLWDMHFFRSPEDRVGMLFWRMHRCARIVFSLSYHMGRMSAEACVDLLVNTVGHELENARAEVRRSFAGDYPPLYQAAYLLGGLQLRALAEEAVGGGKMSQKEFHDAVLRENTMPIALLRAKILNLPVEKPFPNTWRFYDNRATDG